MNACTLGTSANELIRLLKHVYEQETAGRKKSKSDENIKHNQRSEKKPKAMKPIEKKVSLNAVYA